MHALLHFVCFGQELHTFITTEWAETNPLSYQAAVWIPKASTRWLGRSMLVTTESRRGWSPSFSRGGDSSADLSTYCASMTFLRHFDPVHDRAHEIDRPSYVLERSPDDNPFPAQVLSYISLFSSVPSDAIARSINGGLAPSFSCYLYPVSPPLGRCSFTVSTPFSL